MFPSISRALAPHSVMASTAAVTARRASLCLGGSQHTAAVVQGCGKIVGC